MKVKKTEKVIKEVNMYVAEDGEEFETEEECEEYEKELLSERRMKQAEPMRLPELDDETPPFGMIEEENTFRWYRVEDERDFSILNEAYQNSLTAPDTYPEIICVEKVECDSYMNYAYDYHMSTMKTMTEELWDKLGYDVILKKRSKRYEMQYRDFYDIVTYANVAWKGKFSEEDVAHGAREYWLEFQESNKAGEATRAMRGLIDSLKEDGGEEALYFLEIIYSHKNFPL